MFADMLNLINSVSIIRTINTNDEMGGQTSATATSTILSKAAIWQGGSVSRYMSDRLAKTSTHTLAIEYGAYIFNVPASSGGTVIETVSYDGGTYKIQGIPDDAMNLHEIVTVGLERII
jgi:hypothetical protein